MVQGTQSMIILYQDRNILAEGHAKRKLHSLWHQETEREKRGAEDMSISSYVVPSSHPLPTRTLLLTAPPAIKFFTESSQMNIVAARSSHFPEAPALNTGVLAGRALQTPYNHKPWQPVTTALVHNVNYNLWVFLSLCTPRFNSSPFPLYLWVITSEKSIPLSFFFPFGLSWVHLFAMYF